MNRYVNAGTTSVHPSAANASMIAIAPPAIRPKLRSDECTQTARPDNPASRTPRRSVADVTSPLADMLTILLKGGSFKEPRTK
jgi:hypothetical protein